MKIYTQFYTSLEALMWSIFETKCVKVVSFSILDKFIRTDVNALKALYVVFLLEVGLALQEERKIIKETKIPFFHISHQLKPLVILLCLSLKKWKANFF